MTKILKNTTGSDIDIKSIGLTVSASSQITIQVQDYLLLSSDDVVAELQTYISSGDIVVNNGSVDLDSEDGADFILYPDRADAVSFDDSSFGFDAEDVQEAFQELDFIVAPLVVPISLIYNGTLSNNEFIGYSNLLPGDSTPVISPMSGVWRGFTWSNSKDNCDFALEFRIGSTTATPFFTWSVDNTQTADVNFPVSPSVTAGDEVYIKYIDEGTNAADAAIVLKFKS